MVIGHNTRLLCIELGISSRYRSAGHLVKVVTVPVASCILTGACLGPSGRVSTLKFRPAFKRRRGLCSGTGYRIRWEVSEFDRFVRIRRSDRRGSTPLTLRTEVETVCLFLFESMVTVATQTLVVWVECVDDVAYAVWATGSAELG